MSAEILGYKGKTGLNEAEKEEYRALEEILKNVEHDLIGKELLKRHRDLAEGIGDVGMFYCPYIPLMTCGTIIDPDTLKSVVKLKTRYGGVVC